MLEKSPLDHTATLRVHSVCFTLAEGGETDFLSVGVHLEKK